MKTFSLAIGWLHHSSRATMQWGVTRGNANETHRLQRQLPRGECMSMMTGRYGLENCDNE